MSHWVGAPEHNSTPPKMDKKNLCRHGGAHAPLPAPPWLRPWHLGTLYNSRHLLQQYLPERCELAYSHST